jgi:L-amino acid N-acyltransferase YncA
MSPPWIRPAISADLPAVGAIYAHAVHTSTATFDVEQPPLSSWQAKLDSTAVGDHFLIAHDEDTILGMPTRWGAHSGRYGRPMGPGVPVGDQRTPSGT